MSSVQNKHKQIDQCLILYGMKLTGLSGHIRYRGLGIIDVESKIKALKAAWVYRLKESDHCIPCKLYVISIFHVSYM